MNYSAQLKAWREREQLSREQAAGRLGVSFSTYVRWEAGKAPRSLAALVAIKRELSTSVAAGKCD